MILWRQTIGFGLGLVAVSGLWTGAQACSGAEEVNHTPLPVHTDDAQGDDAVGSPIETETPTVVMSVSLEDAADFAAAIDPAAEITPVPTEVLENLSQGQIEAIATIISTAEETAGTDSIANLPAEVLTHLNAPAGVEQQVGRRRRLPASLARRLRLPQAAASLIRQPRHTALVMLGNHIMVVNPVTGAVLGAVRSAL
ncbi:MAG: hypothetical protein WBB18_05830 [Nodosilinea sp.]